MKVIIIALVILFMICIVNAILDQRIYRVKKKKENGKITYLAQRYTPLWHCTWTPLYDDNYSEYETEEKAKEAIRNYKKNKI